MVVTLAMIYQMFSFFHSSQCKYAFFFPILMNKEKIFTDLVASFVLYSRSGGFRNI